MAKPPGNKPPIAGLVDLFSDEFGSLAGPIIDDIKAGIAAKKPVRAAVETALAKHDLTKKIKDSVLEKMVMGAAIGFGIEPSLVADPVGMRKTFLHEKWSKDGLSLSQRIARQEHKAIISDAIATQMSKARSWTKTAEALTNPLKIGGGPDFVKADITSRITELATAARGVAAGDPEALKAFKGKLSAAKRHVARLSLNGAPNQALKTIYKQVITAAEELNEKALDKAMQQAVRDKARYNAERIARTEIARAYGEGHLTRSLADTDVIGRRSILSTRHPTPDICNFHAQADLYGMGPGVTPKTIFPPYPYHPHCLCILVDVYDGEVEPGAFDEKRAIAYLDKLLPAHRKHLLGAEGAATFHAEPLGWKKHLKGWEGHRNVAPLLKPEMFVKPGAAFEAALAADKTVEAKTMLDAMALKQAAVAKARTKADKLIAGDSPLSVGDFTKTGSQAGSNPGGFYKHRTTGQAWYLKEMDGDRARNEILAGKLYSLLGVEVPELQLVEMGTGKLGVASRIIDGLRADRIALTNRKVKGVAEGFGADVWLANWDVTGLSFDNLLIRGAGRSARAVRVDTGGSLLYRAQGGLKGNAFGAEVNEIRTLLDGSNPQAAAVFKLYPKEDLQAAIEKVAKLKDSEVRKLVMHFGPGTEGDKKALVETLLARKKFLKQHLAAQAREAPRPAQAAALTDAEVQKIRDSRINGYAIPSDQDHIEDQQILFWNERDLRGTDLTSAALKVRGDGMKAVQRHISKARSGLAESIPDDGLGDKLVTAIRGIASRAAKGQPLEVKDLDRVREAMVAFKQTQSRITAAVAEGTMDAGTLAEWSAYHQPWMDALEAAVTPGAGQAGAWKPVPGGLFSPFKLPPLKAKVEPKAGIEFVKVQSRFSEKETRRGRTVEKAGTAHEHGFHYEATVRGAVVRYWANEQSTYFTLRGRLEIRVPGEGLGQVEKVYDILKDLGVNHKLAGALDREELYLRQIAYHRRDEFASFTAKVDAISDQAERVAAMRAELTRAIGRDITTLPGYNATGTYQAFGHGRPQFYRPDLEGPDWEKFQEDYVLHHANTGGRELLQTVETILDSGGQMAPTADKLRRGIAPKGMSPTSDLESGGASYFFTRIRPKAQALQPGFVWKSRLVGRLDAISYSRDMYGRTNDEYGGRVENFVLKNRKSTIAEWKSASRESGNETIFKNSLSLFDDLHHIVVGNRAEKEKLLAVFKSHGYEKWPDGRSLEEIVHVAR